MIHDTMSMGEAGIVCVASMLVVFAVLMILYVILRIFGVVAARNTGKAAPAPAPSAAAIAAAAPQQDEGELIAILSAAIAEYERTKCNPFVRNRNDLD